MGKPALEEVVSLPGRVHRTCRRAWSSDFAQKVFETYLTRVGIMALGLVTTVIVSRLLGPSGRGLYAIAVATGTLGVQFGNLGLHTSNIYFAARDSTLLPQLMGNSLAVSFGFGSLLAALVGGVLLASPGLIDLRGATLFLALLWIPFGLAYLLLQDLMLGLQDVRGYNLLEAASKAGPLLFIAVLFAIGRISVAGLFATTVVALIGNCVWAFQRLQPHLLEPPRISREVFRSSFRYALKAYLTTSFCFLVLRADLFMVQHMRGPEQAGYYSIASTMADYVSVVAVIVGIILFPRISALQDIRQKLGLTRKAVLATTAVLLPSLGIAALLAHPIVRLLFGEAFLPAALAFALLMPGMLFLGIHSVAVQFLNSIGFPLTVVYIWGTCTAFNIIVNLWAIPRHGIAGASIVSSVSYFLAFAAVMQVIRRTARQMDDPAVVPVH